MERLEDSKETNVEVEDTEADPDEVAIFSTSVNDPSAGFISRICDGGGEHVDVTDSSYLYFWLFQPVKADLISYLPKQTNFPFI